MSACPNGHEITKGARFCRVCGAVVTSAAKSNESTLPALDSTATVPRTDSPGPTGPQPSSHRTLVLAIVVGLVLAVGAGAASALLLTGGSDERTSGARSAPAPPVAPEPAPIEPAPAPTPTPPPNAPPLPAGLCVHDTTPLNLHDSPGIHANVLGLIMVANCELVDVTAPPTLRFTSDGGETFRRVRWRDMEGWVRSKKVAAGAAPMVTFRPGTDPACTRDAIYGALSSAELYVYTAGNPQVSVVKSSCTGTDAGAVAFAVVQRGMLNPDGRTTEALFRNTGGGWQELAHSGPSLLPQDYAHTGISESTVAGLRSSAA